MPWSKIDKLRGENGGKGDAGSNGSAGSAATVSIGSVSTGAAGSSASVVNAGTSGAAVLNFTIPRGDKGDQGIAGLKGDQGIKGDSGAAGSNGAAGTNATTTAVATTSANGLMSSTDKTKLDALEANKTLRLLNQSFTTPLLTLAGATTLTYAVPGATVGMGAIVNPRASTGLGPLMYAWVSSANTVSVELRALAAIAATSITIDIHVIP